MQTPLYLLVPALIGCLYMLMVQLAVAKVVKSLAASAPAAQSTAAASRADQGSARRGSDPARSKLQARGKVPTPRPPRKVSDQYINRLRLRYGESGEAMAKYLV